MREKDTSILKPHFYIFTSSTEAVKIHKITVDVQPDHQMNLSSNNIFFHSLLKRTFLLLLIGFKEMILKCLEWDGMMLKWISNNAIMFCSLGNY